MKLGKAWKDTDPRDLYLRPYEGTPADLEALTVVRNETLRAVTPTEKFEAWDNKRMDYFYNRGDFNLLDNAWLLFKGDEPIGAAVVYPRAYFSDRPPGNFDLYVSPQYARHGLGSRLMAHLEQAAVERGHHTLETTIAREDEGSTHFLSERGFNVVGLSIRLARPNLDNLPEADLPRGFAIFSQADLNGDAELYRETTNRLGAYSSNYTLLTEPDLETLSKSEEWEPEGIFLLIDDEERIVGLIRASGARTGKGFLHEIRLEPTSRGKGLGTALVAVALRYLRDRGVTHAELDTTGEKTAAHHLALRCGFTAAENWLHFLKRLGT